MNLQKEDRELLPMLDNNILQLIEIKNQVIKNLEEKFKDAHHQRGQVEGEMQKLKNNFDRLNDNYRSTATNLDKTKNTLKEKETIIKNLEEQIKELQKLDVSKVQEQNKKLLQENEKYHKLYDETKKHLDEMIEEEDKKILKKAVKKYMRQHGEDGFVEFRGDDYCEDECRGWDGESYRCECGNRRMDWEWDDGDIYPEPY